MNKRQLLATIMLVAAAALSACSGQSSSSSTSTDNSAATATADNAATSPAAAGDDTSTAIQTLANAEDNSFADQQGPAQVSAGGTKLFATKATVPNMTCLLIAPSDPSQKMVTCFVKTPTQAAADAQYATAKQNVASAMPALNGLQPTPDPKYIAQYAYSDDKHAVLLNEQKKGDGYLVDMSFAPPAFFK
jgi:hypothetical protein